MVNILGRTPRWLSRPSPGHQLFQHDARSKAPQTPGLRPEGSPRKLAHRGTEIFVAVGNELRWSDLALLKHADGEGEDGADVEDEAGQLYRLLKTPVSRPIQQLVVSPSGDFIAIVTSHTCHIGILPAFSHLHSGDITPLRMKCFQVGPTAHVLEQAPIVSTVWHPLSSTGNGLVTVTEDACVRLWELDRDNRSTFDEPSLAVDLKKLANAADTRADLSASKYGVSNGFSPDDVEMQVAAACFGGQGTDEEHGWSSMTLWVAMTEGDVYALCPFLPSKWRAPASMLPSLSTSVVSRMRAANADGEATEAERRVANQQTTWLAQLDAQDAMVLPGPGEYETMEIYNRPEKPGVVPKLQGPFYMTTDIDSGEITDIHVIAPKIDEDDMYDEEEDDVPVGEGLSVGVVCLATSNSKVHICLDLDGVEAEWLPSKRSRAFTFDDEVIGNDLLLFETLDLSTVNIDPDGCSTFTALPNDRQEVFVTTPAGVVHLDFKPWTTLLDDEFCAPSPEGLDFRLRVLLDSASTTLTSLINMPTDAERGVNTAIAVYDPLNLGGVAVLTSAMNTPFLALLDIPYEQAAHPYAPDEMVAALPAPESRSPYQPAEAFYATSALPQLIKSAHDKRLLGSDLKGQVRYSSATLQVMTEAHRILSAETHKLGVAAADLFRRCERMRSELRDQVRRIHEIAGKVDVVVGGEDDEGQDDTQVALTGGATGGKAMEDRVRASTSRTTQLRDRVEALRKKMAGLGGKELSVKEKGFAAEVERVWESLAAAGSASHDTGASTKEAGVQGPARPQAPTRPSRILHMDNSWQDVEEREQRREDHEDEGHEPVRKEAGTLIARLEAVQDLQERLKAQFEEVSRRSEEAQAGAEKEVNATAQGNTFKMRKLVEVRMLLERETALVEGVSERLIG
ncbi:hypothetical protein LTR86_004665 [Recurvomyces mirabilis]|nr:hypothetical protein LTR86_004665 [Recurvomyces mirabilis]